MLAKYDNCFAREKGAVIVVALFFVALVATMAYLMMARLERDTRRTSLLLRATQAAYYAQASVNWAMEQLQTNLSQQKPDESVDKLPIQSPVNEVNGYIISSKITDMQSRLNVNNLNSLTAQTDFKRLMQLLNPAMDEQKVNQIIFALSDWIRLGQQQNEYNQYYMSLLPPYRAAHRPMTSVSELQMIKGMTADLFARLQPYITALPVMTKINIQTAPAVVLAAISPDMTLETGKAIEALRSQMKIASVAAFLNLDMIKNHNVPQDKITAVSQYFLVETSVTIEKQQVVLYTLVERMPPDSPGNGKSSVNVIWQSKGVSG